MGRHGRLGRHWDCSTAPTVSPRKRLKSTTPERLWSSIRVSSRTSIRRRMTSFFLRRAASAVSPTPVGERSSVSFLRIQPAPAFVLNENSYAVTVGQDEEVIEITIENDFITGTVTTTKVDAEYPDNKLTGAVFEIYVDVDGNGEFDAQTDKLVGQMTETDAGIYEMQDLRYGDYFLYEKVAPEGFQKDEGYHHFQIRTDGETVTVENEAGVGFANQPSTGELELTKKDVSNGKLLANVGFRIRNEAGEVVAEGCTDENGIAKFKLRLGKYTYQEFGALEGYILDETEYPFEIKENGEIVKAVMTNTPVPDIPQTGDESNMGFWIGLGAIALGCLVAVVIITIKQKKDEE